MAPRTTQPLFLPALSPLAVQASAPWDGKRRRLTIDQGVGVRRSRLRGALTAAATAVVAPSGTTVTAPGSSAAHAVVEAVACAAKELQRQELAFDEGLVPALEFMGVMGAVPAEVFQFLLAQLTRLLGEALRNGQRQALERVLTEMVQHVQVQEMRDLVAIALQRLADLPPAGEGELQAVAALADRLLKEKVQVEWLPAPLQRRIWETQPALFLVKVQPMIARVLESLQSRLGPLMLDLRQKPQEQRRQENRALQNLVDLVGVQPKLYEHVLAHLVRSFHVSAMNGTPAARLPCKQLRTGHKDSGAFPVDDDVSGAPTSFGPEPLLSTVRSHLLLSLIDRGVLRETIAGTWSVSSDVNGQIVQYKLSLTQRGSVVSGTSTLDGIREVHGALENRKLFFQQIGHKFTFACCCEVSPDSRSLIAGRWRQETGEKGCISIAMPTAQGSFSGLRTSPAAYADANGESWDEMAPLICALDKIHRRKCAVDSSLCTELQQLAGDFTSIADLAKPGSSNISEQCGFVLMDPCITQSIIRGLLAMRRESYGDSANGSGRVGFFTSLHLLICGAGATIAAAAGGNKPALALGFLKLKDGPPCQEALHKEGLRCDLLGAILHNHARRDVDFLATQVSLNKELGELLQCTSQAGKGSSSGFLVARLIGNALANKCLLFRQRTALEDTLALVAASDPAGVQHASGTDWVLQQRIEMLVSTALHLGESFDSRLRRLVTEYVLPLARTDPWVHHRVAQLLSIFRYPNFASSREEIVALTQVLQHGQLENNHHNWAAELSDLYLPTVCEKNYLVSIYRKSRLGKRFPPELALLNAEEETASSVENTGARVGTAAVPTAPSPVSTETEAARENMALSLLMSPDGLMLPQVSDIIRDYCAAPGNPAKRAREAIQLLAQSFQGYHWLTHLAAKWVISLGSIRAAPPRDAGASDTPRAAGASLTRTSTPESLLRSLLRRKMVADFDAQKADPLLMPLQGMPQRPAWLDPFIQVPEWRGVVYELAKQHRGQASSFLSAVLLQISEAESYKEELVSNTSSTSNFIVFCRTLRSELTRFFSLLNEDESLVIPAVGDFCKVCSFSEYTYVYAQAVLHQLMRIRPRERQQLRHISQSLTDAASERSGSVLRLDLRFTSAGQHPEVFKVLYSMCRFGREIRVNPAEITKLAAHVEALLEWKIPTPTPRPSSDVSGADAQESSAAALGGAIGGSVASDNLDEGHGTEAMSDAGSWLDPEERKVWDLDFSDEGEHNDEAANESQAPRMSSPAESSCALAPTAANRKRKPAPTEQQSERTPSIFNMPAVSSAASGARLVRRDSSAGEAGSAPNDNSGITGVLEALRCPLVLEALVAKFVDPSTILTPRDQRAFSRVLALVTVEGLWPTDSFETVGLCHKEDETQAIAAAAADELGRLYYVARHPQYSWLKRVALMTQLQHYAITSLAGLRWVVQVLLTRRLSPRDLLVRMAQSVLFVLLRGACEAHPSQVKSVLCILQHILDLLPYAVADDGEVGKLVEAPQAAHSADGLAGDVVTVTRGQDFATHRQRVGKMIASTLAYIAIAHGCALQVLECAWSTSAIWGLSELRLFAGELLASITAPFSLRFTWACSRFLASQRVLLELTALPEMHEALLNFCNDGRACLQEALDSSMKEAHARSSPTTSLNEDRRREAAEAICAMEAQLRSKRLSPSLKVSELGEPDRGVLPPPPTVVVAIADTPAGSQIASQRSETAKEPDRVLLEQSAIWDWWSSKQRRKSSHSVIASGEAAPAPKLKRNSVLELHRRKGRKDRQCHNGKDSKRVGPHTEVQRKAQKRKPEEDSNEVISSGEEEWDFSQRLHHVPTKASPTTGSSVCGKQAQGCTTRGSEAGTSDTASIQVVKHVAGVAQAPESNSRDVSPMRHPGEGADERKLGQDQQLEHSSPKIEAAEQHLGGGDANSVTSASRIPPRRRLCVRGANVPDPRGVMETSLSAPPAAPDTQHLETSRSQSTVAGRGVPTASQFRLDLEALQGSWKHSWGMSVNVSGGIAKLDPGQPYVIKVQSDGTLEMSGWIASRDRSTIREIVWVKDMVVCSWIRPPASTSSDGAGAISQRRSVAPSKSARCGGAKS